MHMMTIMHACSKLLASDEKNVGFTIDFHLSGIKRRQKRRESGREGSENVQVKGTFLLLQIAVGN